MRKGQALKASSLASYQDLKSESPPQPLFPLVTPPHPSLFSTHPKGAACEGRALKASSLRRLGPFLS